MWRLVLSPSCSYTGGGSQQLCPQHCLPPIHHPAPTPATLLLGSSAAARAGWWPTAASARCFPRSSSCRPPPACAPCRASSGRAATTRVRSRAWCATQKTSGGSTPAQVDGWLGGLGGLGWWGAGRAITTVCTPSCLCSHAFFQHPAAPSCTRCAWSCSPAAPLPLRTWLHRGAGG